MRRLVAVTWYVSWINIITIWTEIFYPRVGEGSNIAMQYFPSNTSWFLFSLEWYHIETYWVFKWITLELSKSDIFLQNTHWVPLIIIIIIIIIYLFNVGCYFVAMLE